MEVACVVCGGAEFVLVCSAAEIEAHQHYLQHFHRCRLRAQAPQEAMVDRAAFTQDYATDIVACSGCGLLLRNPRPRRTEIERAYQQDDYGVERLEAMFVSQQEHFRPKAYSLASQLRPGARVVEVGSFVGGFLAMGCQMGWEMLGVDLGEEVTDFCGQRGLPVFRSALEEAPIEPESVDCVAIWNTFDQIPDPRGLLATIRTLLRPGGLLIVRLPNGVCFRWGIARYRQYRHTILRPFSQLLLRGMAWNNLLAFPYLFGYSILPLDRLMSEYGLTHVAVKADTLVRLADEFTLPWAAWEEWAIKTFWGAVTRLEYLRSTTRHCLSPWIDVHYRLRDK